jgi:beta-glucanase (GH16 family)
MAGFWMLGANIDQVSWPHCGELDLLEHVNNENVVHGTHHYDNNGHVFLAEVLRVTLQNFKFMGLNGHRRRFNGH